MAVKGFYLMPHPPIIIPEVGRGEEQKISKTIESMLALGDDIKKKNPKTIIIITPHGTMFQDDIALSYDDDISGDLKQFKAPQVTIRKEINKRLTDKIFQMAGKNNVPAILATNRLLKRYNTSLAIDHGALVPLYFVEKIFQSYNLVHITYAPLGDIELYKFGMAIAKAVDETGTDAVIIASGDLSHRLKDEGPYDYSPFGERFDSEFLEGLQAGDVLGIFHIDRKTISEAGECGRRSVCILLGALDGYKFRGDLMSYEGPFGVGYGVMNFNITGRDESKLNALENERKRAYEEKLNQNDPYVRLARESLTNYVTKGTIMKDLPDYVTDDMKNNRQGVFVSIKKFGNLRGCIGTTMPTTDSIAREIISNAIAAGTRDPRFDEVEESELMDLDFSVDVLSEAVDATIDELDPKEYGVIVSCKGRQGLLLPDLEGVDTVEEQLSIALKKAGIRENEYYKIKKFKVTRHHEI